MKKSLIDRLFHPATRNESAGESNVSSSSRTHHPPVDLEDRAITAAGQRAFFFSILVNFFLFLIKMAGSRLGHSEALFADGLDTLSDILKTTILAIAFSYSRRPPDEDHPYGHGKADPMAAWLSGFIILLFAGGILWGSIKELLLGATEAVPNQIALGAALVSIVAKEILFRVNIRVGSRIKSEALVADAWNYRMDAFSSVTAALGVLAVILFGAEYWYADNLAAIVVGIMMIRVAWGIYASSRDQLMDAVPASEDLEEVREAALATPGVERVSGVRVRCMGTTRVSDVKIEVNGSMTVTEGHNVASAVRRNVQKRIAGMHDVHVHVEPLGHERHGDKTQ